MTQELLSLHDAARYKDVPVEDVRDAVHSGELPAVRQGGAEFLRPEDLDRWSPHMMTEAGADFNDAEAEYYLRTPDTPD